MFIEDQKRLDLPNNPLEEIKHQITLGMSDLHCNFTISGVAKKNEHREHLDTKTRLKGLQHLRSLCQKVYKVRLVQRIDFL